MHFSTLIAALAVAADVASAGRSLKHVGKEDKINPLARRVPNPKLREKRQSPDTESSCYLTNATQSMPPPI